MTDRDEAPPKLGLKTRLHAWWEGYDLAGLKRRESADEDKSAEQAAQPEAVQSNPNLGMNRWGKPLWSATRVEVAETLWGEGFITPGGTDHVPYLVKPLGLNPAMSVLDLSAGLGGTSRAMASTYGCWVVGLESSPILAKEGMVRSFKLGLEKKAPIESYDPENFSFSKRVDAILYKEGMFAVRNKDHMFDAIEEVLKPRGHLLITDYTVATDKKDHPAIKHWSAHDPLEPYLWTQEQMTGAFAQRNLDLRIAEDLTDLHRSQILTAIQALVGHLERYQLAPQTKIAVVEEVEMWARRVAAIEGGLKVFRFYAIKPPE